MIVYAVIKGTYVYIAFTDASDDHVCKAISICAGALVAGTHSIPLTTWEPAWDYSCRPRYYPCLMPFVILQACTKYGDSNDI